MQSRLNQRSIEAFYYKGLSLEKVNRVEGSIHVFEVLLEIDPGNSDAHYHKGLALATLGDHRDAITLL